MTDDVVPPIPVERSFFNARTKFALGGIVLALAIGYLIYMAFPGNAHYYLTISELQKAAQSSNRVVRVAGNLVPDTFARVDNGKQVAFVLTDGPSQLHATYDGVVPDLFFNPHSEVVLEGKPGPNGVFLTDDVIVKCPTKYQGAEYQVPDTAKSAT